MKTFRPTMKTFRPTTKAFRPAMKAFRPTTKAFRPTTEAFRPTTEAFRPTSKRHLSSTFPRRGSKNATGGRRDPPALAEPPIEKGEDAMPPKLEPLEPSSPHA